MSVLRTRFLEDMQLHGYAPKTQECYVATVASLAKYFGKSPALITEEELRRYFLHLTLEKKVARTTATLALCGIKFFFQNTLQRSWPCFQLLRPPKSKKLPPVLSRQEVQQILACVCQPRYRVCLTTIYACGLRLSEGLFLQVGDVDSARMLLRIHGKGSNYAKVVVMQRWIFCNRAEPIFALYLAWGWGRRKTGGIYEKRAFFRFRPDTATVQEPLGASAHGRQLPWHNSHSLCIGFACPRVYA